MSLPDLFAWLPYVLALIGVAMSLVFHQSRLIYPFCILAGGYYFALVTAPNGPDDTALGQIGFAALVLLLPLNLIVASFFKQAAILSPLTVIRVAFQFIQIAVVVTIIASPQWQDIAVHLHGRMLTEEYDHWTWLTQPSLMMVIVCALVAIVRAVMSGVPIHMGAFGIIILSTIALHYVDNSSTVIVFFSLALLNYIIALVHDTYRMAFLDELTGLPGRRALMSLFSVLGPRYVVAMCDIDHFKKFNDTYGHDVGDQVLKMVAGVLGDVSGGGRAYRYGGEEFTIVFPRRDTAYAMQHLERVRQNVEAASFALRDKNRPKEKPKSPASSQKQTTVTVAISIGVADKNKYQGNPMEIRKEADKALYRAKKAGRNCVSE
ncbi:MAG: GGDEF domain-containing protein [Rhodospirillales bacterium]|nr:GGDEF domain-containing protein [Rhodospirillales bacterium]